MPQLMKKKDPLTESIINSLNPVQENVLKTVQKVQKQQIEEAMQQGVPAEHILQQSGISFNGGGSGQAFGGGSNVDLGTVDVSKSPNELNQALVGGMAPGVPQQPQTPVDPTKRTLLGNILNTIGNLTGINPMNEAVDSLRLQNSEMRSGRRREDKESLIRNRNLESDLMEKQLAGGEIQKVYRNPVTGEQVDEATALEDMKNGLGVYQVNQVISTRAGIVERPLNKPPDLTEGEKRYVTDTTTLNNSLDNLDSGFDALYEKYGNTDWQAYQMQSLPYIFTKDQDVQNLKSDLIALKAAIPFQRGGKALTKSESERIDVMLNPLGKTKETYKKDLKRFKNEFMTGEGVIKYGLNAGLMKKLVKPSKSTKDTEGSTGDMSDEKAFQEYLKARGK